MPRGSCSYYTCATPAARRLADGATHLAAATAEHLATTPAPLPTSTHGRPHLSAAFSSTQGDAYPLAVARYYHAATRAHAPHRYTAAPPQRLLILPAVRAFTHSPTSACDLGFRLLPAR